MTPAEEHVLYETDHTAWCQHVAPRWAELLKAADDGERRRLWSIASIELRGAINALAKAKVPHGTQMEMYT